MSSTSLSSVSSSSSVTSEDVERINRPGSGEGFSSEQRKEESNSTKNLETERNLQDIDKLHSNAATTEHIPIVNFSSVVKHPTQQTSIATSSSASSISSMRSFFDETPENDEAPRNDQNGFESVKNTPTKSHTSASLDGQSTPDDQSAPDGQSIPNSRPLTIDQSPSNRKFFAALSRTDAEVEEKSTPDETGSQLSLLQFVTKKVSENANTTVITANDDVKAANDDVITANDDVHHENDSSFSSSFVTSSSSTTSTGNDNENTRFIDNDQVNENKTELPSKKDKEIQFSVRPKSAKPPRPSKVSNGDKIEKQSNLSSKKNPKRHVKSPSTSSFSSVGTSDRESFVKESKHLNEREQKARELFLHRCLDEHLTSQLDKHRSYFDRAFPVASSGRKRKIKKNETMSSSMKRNRMRSRASNTGTILPAFSPLVREDEVKRNIERLVSELAKNESMKSLMKPAFFVNQDQENNDKSNFRKKRSSKKRSERHDSGSGSDGVSAHVSAHDEHRNKHNTKSFSEELHKKNGEEEKKIQKSILKSNKSAIRHKNHVQLVGEEMVEEELVGEETCDDSTKVRKEFPVKSHQKSFTKSQLVALLASIGPADYILSDNYGQLHHVTLRHTPIDVKAAPSRPRYQPKQKRKKKPVPSIKMSDPDKIEKSSDSTKNDEIIKSRPKSAVKKAESLEDAKNNFDVNKSTARVRPGTESIKCNWKPEVDNTSESKIKFSDHQLKNSNNHAVLEWLSRKNVLERQNRIHRFRENRSKRDRLMEEHNEREDKRESALIEYEKWKKKKNREILLRRRKEALEANEEKVRNQTILDDADRSNAMTKQTLKESAITTFSDLRSSAITPHPPSIISSAPPDGGRRRPKSAPTKVTFGASAANHKTPPSSFIPVRIDVKNGDVTILSPRDKNGIANLSAREPMMQDSKSEGTANFMRNLLESKPTPPSMFDIPPPGTFTKPENQDNSDQPTITTKSLDKDHYDNWVRSKGTSSPYKVRYNKKKEKKAPMPPHDPLTNEMLTELAKRRIKKILDQKKRVDSGLVRKKREPEETQNTVTNNTVAKWRLKGEPTVDMNLQPIKRRVRKNAEDKRPVFTYPKKTKSKSLFHERNPLINQAINT